MNEFETLLKEYRKLAVQVQEEREYFEYLQRQLRQVENRLKEMFAKASSQPERESLLSTLLDNTPMESVPTGAIMPPPEQASSALTETVRAVAELGGGVSAEQLAKHLNVTRDAARLRLQRAEREGLIARIAVGRYRAIKRGLKEPETSSRASGDTQEIGKVTAQGSNGIMNQDEPEGKAMS